MMFSGELDRGLRGHAGSPESELESIQRFRVELSDAIKEIQDSREIGNMACRMVCEFLGASRSTYALAFPEEERLEVQDGWKDGRPGRGAVYSYKQMGLELLSHLSAGETVVVDDSSTHPLTRDKFASAYQPLEICSFVAVSLVKSQNLIAILSMHHSAPRHWKTQEIDLLRDVTQRVWDAIERSRAEAQLKRMTKRYRALCETAASVVFIASPEGRITEIPILRGLDPSFGQVAIGDGWLDAIHPIDRRKVSAKFRRSAESRTPFATELRLKMSGGEFRWHSVRAVPMEDEHGAILEWVGAFTDIHESSVQQQTLRLLEDFSSSIRDVDEPEEIVSRAQHLLNDLLNSSGIDYYEPCGEDGAWVRFGRAKAGQPELDNGYPPGFPFLSCLTDLQRGKIVAIENVEQAATADSALLEFRRFGIEAWACAPLLNDGSLVAMLAAYQDEPRAWTLEEIELVRVLCDRCWSETQRARAQKELKQSELRLRTLNAELDERVRERTAELLLANEDMEGFTYSVAHDFRAPLRSIIANSKILLMDSKRLSDDERSLLERQAFSAKRLGELIDELLKLSRINRQGLQKSQLDLSALGEEAIKDVRCGTCDIQIEPGLNAVGDPLLVRLALLNLLGNACKFSPAGGVIRFGRKILDGEIVFFVADSGIGFEPQYANKIFEPFQRLVQDSAFPGTGIGLANVKRIINRHGGKVWAESAPGVGSSFYFTLPEHQATADEKPANTYLS